ncbi:MAG: hypothetical protein ACW99G_00475 [Candidatus Thorarchaeota archaeon]
MPLVLDTDPITAAYRTGAPNPQRGVEFRRYLSSSVRIGTGGSYGSGTIVHYDRATGWAYVASCGHLWNGNKSASELKKNPKSATITVWYKNNEKLSTPANFRAEILFWSNSRGYDSSCLRFRPDWIPNVFPIAPENYNIKIGSRQHSLGCDHAKEVAHYDVEIIGIRGMDLITRRNSPRPGRSGGGMLSEDGFYIATCWGTSAYDGSGTGYFTPLSSIHKVFRQNGYSWLLGIQKSYIARRIPIKDWMNPDAKYPENFIPIPGGGTIKLP